jgi:hypothetical protein
MLAGTIWEGKKMGKMPIKQIDDLEVSLDEPQENDADLGKINLSQSHAVTWATDWTTETIISQLKKGNIQLNPSFQRRDAWRKPRKSQFIESLMLGFPIPQIVLAEKKEKNGQFIVIDGKQRLLSLAQFVLGQSDGIFESLELEGLTILNSINGKNYLELSNDQSFSSLIAGFDNQPIRTVVIKNWPNEDFIYSIFLRLNTNSVRLSPQELRQALHPGPFTDWVDQYSLSSITLMSLFKSERPDFRMRDIEVVLRYIAFLNFIDEYKGNLKSFLDLTTERMNLSWNKYSTVAKSQIAEFEEAIAATVKIFGSHAAFRKWNGREFEGPLNRAVLDIMLWVFSDPDMRRAAIKSKSKVVETFKSLCSKDREFLSSLETTTKSIVAVATRFNVWSSAMKRITKKPLRCPTLEKNKVVIR